MADKTNIEWTDATWNIITGCTLVDDGCTNCYAAHLIGSWPAIGNHPSRTGLARKNAAGVAKFTGEVRFNEAWLDQPLRWKKPRRIFVCAHGDLFHESVPDEWLDRVFAVMALCPQHTFQVLTKRPERARDYLSRIDDSWHGSPDAFVDRFNAAMDWNYARINNIDEMQWPLPNVWLGTSVSDQASADKRIPDLLATPAAVRFLSMEPLLGPVDLTLDGLSCGPCPYCADAFADPETGLVDCGRCDGTGKGVEVLLDWVIVGGESGPNARPMHPDHARKVRDQCVAAGASFFFKQWGEWSDGAGVGDEVDGAPFGCFDDAGHWVYPVDQEWANAGRQIMFRIGKKRAGRQLDGRTWDEMPGVRHG